MLPILFILVYSYFMVLRMLELFISNKTCMNYFFSSIKLKSYGDDEETETRLIQPLNVSYVDFTKTRLQTQILDGLLSTTNISKSRGNKQPITTGTEKSNNMTNGKAHINKTKIMDNEMSFMEKAKTKRQNKTESDPKQSKMKLSKKQKRDV